MIKNVYKKLRTNYHITDIETLEKLVIIAKDFIDLERTDVEIKWVTTNIFPMWQPPYKKKTSQRKRRAR